MQSARPGFYKHSGFTDEVQLTYFLQIAHSVTVNYE